MTKYMSNVNEYLSQLKIKQAYLSRMTGIDKNKLSRLLTGAQGENGKDMEEIAKALGKNVEYFLSDSFSVPKISSFMPDIIAFYAGEPTAKQEKIAKQLFELMENIDEVLSAKSRFCNIARNE